MAMQIAFPAMHYVTLALLAMAICISFLVATDQSKVIFESLQVRILWTILIGSFTSLAVVCYDLSSPFVGAYKVSTLLHFCYLSAVGNAAQPFINAFLSV
jgi:dolichyl-phosphate-mannose--protein O-mannosyl transferase